MNKRRVRWEKIHNPLLPAGLPEEETGRIALRSTPFGVEGLQFNPEFPSERAYIAHTNFDIDELVKSTVENIEGVEILEIYSPYRMRITVGKAFNPREVRRVITEKLCREIKHYNFDEATNVKIYQETLKMKKQNELWSIFILPNGNYESMIFSDKNEMENTLSNWESIRQRIGGIILTE